MKATKNPAAGKAEEAIRKLRVIACKAERHREDAYAMEAVRAAANLQYLYNQWYVDDGCEEVLRKISMRLPSPGFIKEKTDDRTVLFYDSFGLDVRGLAIIYLKALADLGYHVVYLTQASAKDTQPQIHHVTSGKRVTFLYLPRHACLYKTAKKIVEVFEVYRPAHAFFYCTPDDVAACVAFDHYEGIVHRYQINLTDHAFWLGKGALDTCIEFRDYGASVSVFHRGIPRENLQILPYYPYADLDLPFAGFPQEIEGHPVMFSGGGLYKTIGDGDRYYKMVRMILEQEPGLKFLYAGAGDASGLDALQRAYPGRVIHIAERRDLYQLMEHIDLYLNTYPIGGGLMVQYAARAGKVPLTLQRKGDGDEALEGILLHPETNHIEFETVEELVAEVHHLLHNSSYEKNVSQEMQEQVISEETFQEALSRLLEGGGTGFAMEIHPIDTSGFLATYAENLTQYQVDGTTFVPRRSLRLAAHFLDAGWRRLRTKWRK